MKGANNLYTENFLLYKHGHPRAPSSFSIEGNLLLPAAPSSLPLLPFSLSLSPNSTFKLPSIPKLLVRVFSHGKKVPPPPGTRVPAVNRLSSRQRASSAYAIGFRPQCLHSGTSRVFTHVPCPGCHRVGSPLRTVRCKRGSSCRSLESDASEKEKMSAPRLQNSEQNLSVQR